MEIGRTARKIMVALEENDESLCSLEWALNHLGSPVIGSNTSEFVILYVSSGAMSSTPLTGKEIAFSNHVFSILERNQKRTSQKVVEQAKVLCQKHDIACEVKVVVGEAKIVICDMAKKLGVDLLVVGSHDSGRLKRFFSGGSIEQYCVDHAKCSVVIVRRPQHDL